MQPEGELDGIGDVVGADGFAALVLERVGRTARGQEPLLKVLAADDPEMLRGDWFAVPLHCVQKLGNALAVDLIDAVEGGQRLMRAADLIEDLALERGP